MRVERDCSLPGHPEAYCIGDMAYLEDKNGHSLPGVSPVAMQQARFVVKAISRQMDGQAGGRGAAFHYVDKGIMATIGRKSAIAQTGPFRLTGFLAWLAWLAVHIYYLIGFRNRFVVIFSWVWSYLTYRRGARIITAPDPTSPRSLPPPSRHAAARDASPSPAPERSRP